MIKILHCADIHLDSPFAALPAERAEVRRSELRAAFTSMILYARMNGCDLLLMAGDVVDNSYATRETAQLLQKEFASIPKTNIVIAPGNHDPYTRSSIWSAVEFPKNVSIFDSEKLSYFSFDELNTDVYGYAFTSPTLDANPAAGHRPLNPDRINLLCAHCEMNVPGGHAAPIADADMEASGMDYAALGHNHNTSGIHCLGQTWYGYSGCLEGRGFGECGYKGAVWVEIDRTDAGVTVNPRGIRFSKRRYESLTIDATGFRTAEELSAAYKSAVRTNGYGEDTTLRVILEGTVSPTFSPEEADLGAAVVVDQTVPAVDDASLLNDPGLRGAFYRELLPLLQSGSPDQKHRAALALRLGLASLES